MDVDNSDEICGRCLINPDARTVIVAIWGDGSNMEHAPSMTPPALKKWLQKMLYINGARFELGATSQRVEAISTWHGDPVCGYHLWQLAEAEMRNGYRR